MLFAKNIHKSFGQLSVLKGVDISIGESEIVSIVGKSGSGKSTLLHILGTLDQPDEGLVQYDNLNVIEMKQRALADFRNKNIGFIFQFHHLLNEFNALENVCIPALIAGLDTKKAESKAKELLELLGLQDRMDHKPQQLSGGEQQRVAVARALINDPKYVFADEPSGNLDAQTSEELHEIIFGLRDKLRQSFVIVTHNEELAKMSDRSLMLQNGSFIKD